MFIERTQVNGDASEATLQQIKTLLETQKEFVESIWVDSTNTYFIRRVVYDENTGAYTTSYMLADGTVYVPVPPIEPASSGDREITQQEYIAKLAGTGYSIDDAILRVVVIDANTATVDSTIWYNMTTGLLISAPVMSDIEAVAGLQSDMLANLISLNTVTGIQADIAYTSGSGSIVSILKGVFGRLLITRNAGVSDADTVRTVSASDSPEVTAIGATSDVAWTTGSGTVISILKGIYTAIVGLFDYGAGAVGSVTIRTTQASDSPLVTSTGGVADSAYTTGSGSVISILKGLFDRLLITRDTGASDTNTIRIVSASDSPDVTSLSSIDGKLATLGQKNMAGSLPIVIASDQSTVPVSAASLPLPTGAATETTLSAVDTSVGTTNTRIGDLTETAPGSDTASSGLNGRLQRIAQRITSLIDYWITPGTAIGTLPVSPTGVSDGSNWIRLRSDANGRLELSPNIVALSATQSTANFYVNAAVTVDQNSASTATTPSTGSSWIVVTNNSGVICDITIGGTSGGADGTTILTVIAGDVISMPLKLAASVVLRIKPRVTGLTTNDFVAVRVT